MQENWTDLHHQILKLIKKYHFENSTFLVACSGGLDSVAGFYLLRDLKMNVELCHIHHGGKSRFRRQASDFVKKLAEKEQVLLHHFESSQSLSRENEMRNFRRNIWRQFLPTHVVTLMHQKEDLLETRLMRLIRGTGPQGLRSMSAYQGHLFRPLLGHSKNELKMFLIKRKLRWIEDPSNLDPKYFRNFIRHQWLPILEKQKPGSLARLAKSIENLIPSRDEVPRHLTQISMENYLSLSEKAQIQALALLLKNNGYHQFGLSQLKEIQKQLDKQQKHHKFKCAGAQWVVNAQQISLEK